MAKQNPKKELQVLLAKMPLSSQQIEELYYQSLRMKEGWTAPGMEAYDQL